jgi:hypothetical protein
VAPLLANSCASVVRVPWVVREAMGASCGIPVTAVMGVLRLAKLVSAGGGVDDGAPAPSGVVVAEADVQASGILCKPDLYSYS